MTAKTKIIGAAIIVAIGAALIFSILGKVKKQVAAIASGDYTVDPANNPLNL